MVNHAVAKTITVPPGLASTNATSHPDQVWDCQQAARFLHIHPKTVVRLARGGQLPFFAWQPVAFPPFRSRRLGAQCANLTTLFAPRIEEDSFAAKHVSIRLD